MRAGFEKAVTLVAMRGLVSRVVVVLHWWAGCLVTLGLFLFVGPWACGVFFRVGNVLTAYSAAAFLA